MRRIQALVVVGVAVASFCIGVRPAAAAGVTTFVNCESTDPAPPDGSQAHPFKSLAQVNARTYSPGDSLLFKGGTTCTGTLAPTGTGSAAGVWTISNYPIGSPRAKIVGNGADNAVLLRNAQWVEISSLELTNSGPATNDRRGLHVLLENVGTGTHYRVTNLDVHDIGGIEQGGTQASAAILFSVQGAQSSSHFEDVRVTGNLVTDVSFNAIQFGTSYWRHRAVSGSTPEQIRDNPWTPHTNVLIDHNTMTNVGTSGTMVEITDGAVVEHNTVFGHSSNPAIGSVGIWTINADDTVIQFNSVAGGQQAEKDGMAYDADYATNRVKIQYNYSASNAGGFVLVCPVENKPVSAPVIRYNISDNDRTRGVSLCTGGNLQNGQIYNNTLSVGDGRSMAVFNQPTGTHNVQFRNNVVVKEGSGAAWISLQRGTAVQFSTNVLRNVLGTPDNANTLNVDPRLTNRGAGAAGSTLHQTSPAHAAGLSIAQNGNRDYFGNVVPTSGPVDIGAYEGSGTAGAAPPPVGGSGPNLLTNGDFETGTKSPWVTNWWAITPGGAHSGSYGARLNHPSNIGQIYQTVGGLQPGGKYLLSGWVISPDGITTSFYVNGYGSSTSVTQSGTTWWHFAMTFTVQPGFNSATVTCLRGGTAPANTSCDDIAVVRIG